jgi:hypothetical protein
MDARTSAVNMKPVTSQEITFTLPQLFQVARGVGCKPVKLVAGLDV